MGFGQALLPGYQLVLARFDGESPTSYTPDVVFQLYLAPTDITVRWRESHQVTALQGGAHVDSGFRLLGDMTIRYNPGIGLMLSSSASGSPLTADGRQRARELRTFLGGASELIRQGSHRLEFHSDARDYHLVIVPAMREQTMSSRSTSRVGGDEFNLAFTIVGEVADGVTLFGQLNDTFDGAIASMRRASGALALSIATIEQTTKIPLLGGSVVLDALGQARELVNRVGAVVSGFRRIAALPLQFVRQVALIVDDAKEVFTDAEDFVNGDVFRQLGDEIDLIWFSMQQSIQGSTDAPGGDLAAIISGSGLLGDNQFATIEAGLVSGDPLVDNIENTQAFLDDWTDVIDQYTGWQPYSVKEGETLVDIAGEQLGDESQWIYLAIVNGLDGSQVIAGTVLKLPTLTGGIPFDLDGVIDLQQLKKLIEERLYFRDLKLREAGQGLIDLMPNEALDDVATITGIANYLQRYEKIVFRTELGRNKAFPGVGIYIGVGEARLANVIGLTHASARQQLLADPRTEAVQTRERRELADTVRVAFDIETVSVEAASSVVLNTGSVGGTA